MSEREAPPDAPPRDDEFARAVRQRAERLKRGRRKRFGWRQLAQVGVLAWIFLLPTLGGAALGRLVARLGGIAWAPIAGLALGLLVGIYGAWRQLRWSLRDEEGDR